MFRFHTGSIKRCELMRIHKTDQGRFRFHTGSIKRQIALATATSSSLQEFRFHTGSIKRYRFKTREELDDKTASFDSILVRLKVRNRAQPRHFRTGTQSFDSILVRLKGRMTGIPSTDAETPEFRFHTGSIKRGGRHSQHSIQLFRGFDSILVRLKVSVSSAQVYGDNVDLMFRFHTGSIKSCTGSLSRCVKSFDRFDSILVRLKGKCR